MTKPCTKRKIWLAVYNPNNCNTPCMGYRVAAGVFIRLARPHLVVESVGAGEE